MDSIVARQIYTQMVRIAAVDTAIRQGISAGRFQFIYWPMTGQEGIPAAMSAALKPDDYMITTYRGIHDHVAKGVPLRLLLAETMGRGAGVNKGKGGSTHLTHPQSGSVLTTAIVGGGAPIANGFGLASKHLKDGRVTVVNFGDGATSIGAVHEAMNMAAVWKLPVIFLLQNNQIGEYTPIPEYTATKQFVDRAPGYGMKGLRVDGNDIEAMFAAASEAVAFAREGSGPVFLEAMTIRLGPHVGIGPVIHLSEDELEAAKMAAPIPRARAMLLAQGVCSVAELDEIDAAAKREVEEAVAWAAAQEPPAVQELFTDIYGSRSETSATIAVSGEEQEMSFSQAVRDAMDVALARDPRVILLGEDIGDPPGGVQRTTEGLQTKHGKDRVLPTPIAETAIIGAGMGSAMAGLRPVCEIMFSDFLTVCLDPLANHAAKQRFMSGGLTNVPLTVRLLTEPTPLGGLGAQHSQSLEAWLTHIPGLKVVFPSCPRDAKGLLASCIEDPDPCVILESRRLLQSMKGPVPTGDYRVPIGLADVKRPGKDISLIAYGWQVNEALQAAEELSKSGVDAEVLDLRSLVPLDKEAILKSVRKTRRALVVHAATQFCGFSAEVAQMINYELFSELKAPADRLGAEFTPIPAARNLEAAALPNSVKIIERAKALLDKRETRYQEAKVQS